jgi:hypothetical protein
VKAAVSGPGQGTGPTNIVAPTPGATADFTPLTNPTRISEGPGPAMSSLQLLRFGGFIALLG